MSVCVYFFFVLKASRGVVKADILKTWRRKGLFPLMERQRNNTSAAAVRVAHRERKNIPDECALNCQSSGSNNSHYTTVPRGVYP